MFTVDFDICQLDCDRLLFNDTTGQYIPNLSECCKTGYGYPGNPTQEEVTGVRMSFTYPNGNQFDLTAVEWSYDVPINACDTFVLSGTMGSVALVADGQVIGQAIYVTSLEQTVTDLVNNINAGNDVHNYYASWVLDGGDYKITVCDTCGGSIANGKTIEVCVFQLVSDKTDLILANGENESWCLEFGTGLIEQTQVDNCFNDGVYTATMTVITNDGEPGSEDVEYTATKKFIFDCLSRKCLRDLILLSTGANCPCNDKDIHAKIQELRTDIEAAHILYEECQYDCANDLLLQTQKFCENVCLDCD